MVLRVLKGCNPYRRNVEGQLCRGIRDLLFYPGVNCIKEMQNHRSSELLDGGQVEVKSVVLSVSEKLICLVRWGILRSITQEAFPY